MSRRISKKRAIQTNIDEVRSASPQIQEATALQNVTEGDNYFDKLLKNIPADIIAAWVVVSNLINTDENVHPWFFWSVFGIFIVITFFWTKKQTDHKGLSTVWAQVIAATFAFVVWVFALGGPFLELDFYKPLYGTVFLIIYTLAAPLISPKNT